MEGATKRGGCFSRMEARSSLISADRRDVWIGREESEVTEDDRATMDTKRGRREPLKVLLTDSKGLSD